jgi:4-hydroxyphenylacetate 3-monooxygenase/4-hydroxybutyryl-CoA dehydratase/vinylacetyl-CoA-Delta-isomerase
MGIDAINALDVVTYEVDQATGSDYHRRLENYLKYFQNNDLVASGAQTDVKGDRLRRPHEQEDPDMYLRIVESRLDGIVVRGCKNSITNTAYADEIIALPTRFMSERDSDYAVAFALPSDWDGMRLWQGLLTPTAASS